ncbi:hypothetical protein TRFO_09766 [Tritrichomonas foetus]|uniref:Uncharacterized protein n=1 Tax=Tritrichomonas foetus TaxID=1144522 RepID=A0A1J4JHA1_9EUKA|nr:hypothetical protein TRFO_09766 [Tritrichomonas foetus]|eukprot:OHS96861.1 hypothetical protein TRFO_09766 [Tritrichomonas foetus]
MESLTQQFVLNPFIRPPPTDKNRILPKFEITDTLRTLFVGFDSPFVSDMSELQQMLDTMSQNIPKISKLQTDLLDEGSPPNLHSKNGSLWIRLLADPTVSLYSLVPIPSFEFLELNRLISECIDMKIPPDRAAWAIHNYAKEKFVSPEIITNELISDPKYSLTDPNYFSKFGYALYTRNLVDHSRFIIWMIQNLNPENLIIFKKEILKTHSLLCYAFNTHNVQNYINALKNELLLNKTQLIQFSIISQLQENTFQEFLDRLLTPELKRRVTAIYNLTISQLAFSSVLRNILFLGYPYFATDSFDSDIRKMVILSDDKQIEEHVLTMCKSLLWFDHHLPAVSSIVAFMINILITDIKKIEFPLLKFIKILYENVNRIQNFAFLFAELQEYKFFRYHDFIRTIVITGYFNSKKEETKVVISNLPCASQVRSDLEQLDFAINKLYSDFNFNEILNQIFGDIYNSSDLILSLPYVFRYQISIWLTKHSKSFQNSVKLMNKIGTPNLIVPLFKRMENEIENSQFTIEIKSVIESVIPCFSTHKALASLTQYLCAQTNNPVCLDLVGFLHDHYKSSSAKTSSKSKINDISKNLKNIQINGEQISSLFYKYSYFCSLHIYDAFFAVKTINDFSQTMSIFLRDLFIYPLLTVDCLLNFFFEFSQSMCITRPSQFFIKMMISVIVDEHHFAENQKVKSILESFFTKTMHLKIVEPSLFLETIFKKCKKPKRRDEPQPSALMLIYIFLKIIKESPELFSVENILTESIVKGFIQSFALERNPLTELLLILRSFPPPIITDETLKCIESKDTLNSTGLTYPAALFSLLPTQMQAIDFVDVFYYFRDNVTRTTSTFWTLWLMLRPCFAPGFPVTAVQPDKEAFTNYRFTLISMFSSLLYHAVEGDEKTLVYLNCWVLLCNNITFSKVIVENTINDLRTRKISLSPMMITFLNPALMVITEKPFEALCESICKYSIDEIQFEQYARLAASVFAVFVSRFPTNIEILPMIADKVLEWIPHLFALKSAVLEPVIDVFNFLLCFSNDKSMHDEENTLQEAIHQRIRENLEKVPDEINKFIIVNIPPQVFRAVKDPLYYGFEIQEPEPPIIYQPQNTYSPPDTHDNTFQSTFDNPSLFPSFDDEFPNWF